jgi:excisionase family DNA binding protein
MAQLVTVGVAAKRLGLSLKTCRTRIQRGEWPIYRFGKKSTRLDVEEIKQLVRRPAQKIDGENAA